MFGAEYLVRFMFFLSVSGSTSLGINDILGRHSFSVANFSRTSEVLKRVP